MDDNLFKSLGYFSSVNNVDDPLFLGYETKEVDGAGHKAVYPLVVGNNLFIDNTYHLHSRPGQTQLVDLPGHSIWTNGDNSICLFVYNQHLYLLQSDYTYVSLLSLAVNNRMSYWEWNDRIYFSNGVDIGYYKNGSLFTITAPTVMHSNAMPSGVPGISLMQYKKPMPPGQHLAVYRGHLLSAAGKVLYVSDPMSDCYDVRGSISGTGRSYIPFNDDITMVRPVDEGIFVADGNTWFLKGQSFEEMEKKLVDGFPVIPFTDIQVDGSLIEKNGEGNWAMWMSSDGISVGNNAGTVVNLTKWVYTIPDSPIGAAIARNEEGLVQYIGTIKQ